MTRFVTVTCVLVLLSILIISGATKAKVSPLDPVDIKVTNKNTYIEVLAGEHEFNIQLSPWRFTVLNATTKAPLMEDVEQYRLGFELYQAKDYPIWLAYHIRVGKTLVEHKATNVESWKQVGNTVEFIVLTTDSNSKFTVTIYDFKRRQFSFKARLPGSNSPAREPRVFTQMGFKTPEGEGFFGTGERFITNNHRGTYVRNYVEDSGWSLGSFVSTKSKLRVPKLDSTYISVPFYISTFGYGFELDSNYGSTFDFAYMKKDMIWSQVENVEFTFTRYSGVNPKETLWVY
jgi:alpha-glucosidase (family GH31 glycosyl hydrolase)